jgi:hypothetical protein
MTTVNPISARQCAPWNKERLIGQKRPLKPKDVWTIRVRLPNNQKLSREIYAIYHGGFIEAMLAHLDKRFSYSFVTAMPDADDLV